ncbi:putative L-lysine 2,3-aminomutase [Hyphomonas neptunium ATCC 15444]|uniref:Putative L-lysine 2,3-aminomutase n=2 Tax=Hyphomonas TaxID=85 RepID=Q0BXH9_HYPNA|nr:MULTISPECIES: lysine-2,3-aminomutase-like protein [Hyphomonas]ABI75387.1 putative L-lysine 2,3-aminomutase [Hyphomonas neptunium ATCC 15444]KCZ89923.1 putative L-lysine 2,3-aminomutase [Hyphomonas hirschiana VP5]
MKPVTYRHAGELLTAGIISADQLPVVSRVAENYVIALPARLATLIDRDDPLDPIGLQYVPSGEELNAQPGEMDDPIGDAAHSPIPGIVHRYPDRVLLKITSTCPVYCRFCFRRERVGPEKGDALSKAEIDAACAYIADRPEIFEVILTGGDPMILSPARAGALTRRLEAIDHVKVIRWHSRVPVAAPERVTPEFTEAIRSSEKAVFVAVHANHAREFTPEAVAAIRRLSQAGISLVSQSVLLRGVNDTFEALADLMRAFLSVGIKPYYLHQLDAAPGTSHFRVPVEEGQALVRRLRDELSGLATPTYVADIPGGVSKAVMNLPDIERRDDAFVLRGRDGETYLPPGYTG